jgi:hypothetical protein
MPALAKLQQIVTSIYGNRAGFNFQGDLVANGKIMQAGLGLDPGTTAASATLNTTIIQDALTAGGQVQITTPGTYLINATLTIPNNTWLVGPRNGAVVLKQIAVAGGSGLPLLKNSAYVNASRTVTVSWSSGMTATVTDTAHGLTASDHVSILGLSPSCFNGVFSIASITDVNTYVINLWRLPTTANTGTAACRTANENIVIQGITFDYSANTATSEVQRHAIILGHAVNCHIRDVIVANVEKFGVNLGAVKDCTVSGFGAYVTSSDLVKVYGPARFVRVSNVWGRAGDDGMSFQTKESAAFINYSWCFGDIINCELDGIDVESGIANICAVYCSPNEFMSGVKMRNISGRSAVAGCYIQSAIASSVLDCVEVDGVSCAATYQTRLGGASGFTANRITLKNIGMITESGTTGQALLCDATLTAKLLEIDGLTHENADWPTSAGYHVTISGSTISELVVKGWSVTAAAANGRAMLLQSTATVNKIIFYAPRQQTGDNFIVIASTVLGAPDIQFIGGLIATTAVVNASANCSISFAGVNFSGATNGVVRTGGTPTIAVRSGGGNVLTSGSWIVVPSGTPVLTVYGWDIAIDPIALTGLAGTVGQFCTSTQAGNEGGLAVRGNVNGTPAWYALAGGALGVNAAIT